MNNKLFPIFTTDSSLGRSILTSDDFETIQKDGTKVFKEPDENSVSVWTIARKHELNPVCVVENSMVSFIAHNKYAKKLKKQLIYGVKFRFVHNATDQSENSFSTESDVIVFLRNSEAYSDLVRLYSAIHGNANNFYYYARGDWNILHQNWTKNLLLVIPFYNSFLEKNTFHYGHRAIPEFKDIQPYFLLESHDLPQDPIMTEITKQYCDSHQYPLLRSHSVYYYATKDAIAYQNLRCIIDRTTFDKPELKHFSSDQFSFESFLERANE